MWNSHVFTTSRGRKPPKVLACILMTHKVVVYGVWPEVSTGYGKVVFNMLEGLGNSGLFEVVLYGIQRQSALISRAFSHPAVVLHDAADAFGLNGIRTFVHEQAPDIFLAYNDPRVCASVFESVRDAPCAKVAYLDMVYSHAHGPQARHISHIAQLVDACATFTRGSMAWLQPITGGGCLHYVIGHGCHDKGLLARHAARSRLASGRFKFFNEFARDAFVVLNLNRNTVCKRPDIFLHAAAIVLLNNSDRKYPIVFVLNSSHDYTLDLFNIFDMFARDFGLPDSVKDNIIVNFSNMTDGEVTDLMASADAGVTCSEGEGWGLCSHEHAALAVPQIVSPVGIFPEMFRGGGALFLEPVTLTHHSGGRQVLCSPFDLADKICRLYRMDAGQRERMGTVARDQALRYDWESSRRGLVDALASVINERKRASSTNGCQHLRRERAS